MGTCVRHDADPVINPSADRAEVLRIGRVVPSSRSRISCMMASEAVRKSFWSSSVIAAFVDECGDGGERTPSRNFLLGLMPVLVAKKSQTGVKQAGTFRPLWGGWRIP